MSAPDPLSLFVSRSQDTLTVLRTARHEALEGFEARATTSVSILADSDKTFSPAGTPDQFYVFQLNNVPGGPTVLDATEVEPSIAGGPDQPDVQARLTLAAFHVGQNEAIDKDTRATLRMNIGKDEDSKDKRFDTVFWAIAAGLNLYNDVKRGRAASKDLKSDFDQAFSKRPIEIPGGLARVSFEVVKHKEPPWYKHIFSFLESGTGQALVSALGFPAITEQAIKVVDELISRLDGSSPEVLFKGDAMRLAFSKQARTDYTGGNPMVRMGALSRGFCAFARGRDFQTIADSKAVFYPTTGKLVPASVSVPDMVTGHYNDPFTNVTYAVFHFGTAAVKLDPTFQYGG